MSRKNIILLITFVTLITIAGIIGIILTLNNSKEQATPQGKVSIDPISGEKVTENSSLYQATTPADESDRPIILGINKLTDYGLTTEQEDKVYNAIYSFSANQKPRIKNISFYKDSYSQRPPDDTGIARIMLKMRASSTTDYYLDIAYGNTTDATTTIYAADMKTVLFTQ